MGTNRIEAFSDGVIAVIITITVLDLHVPKDSSLAALVQMVPLFLTYILSFIVVAIMWVNHHYMMHLAKHPTAKVLWANNMLLFWMSLIPFTTSYMGQNHGKPLAVAAYGAVLTLCAMSFTTLRHIVNQFHIHNELLAEHNRRIVRKSAITSMMYAASIPLAYYSVNVSFAIFVYVPVSFFLPERKLAEAGEG
jgi:uncharacterized membrane protein